MENESYTDKDTSEGNFTLGRADTKDVTLQTGRDREMKDGGDLSRRQAALSSNRETVTPLRIEPRVATSPKCAIIRGRNAKYFYMPYPEVENVTSVQLSPPMKTGSPPRDVMDEAALVPPWKTCVVLSISFFFIYTAFESIQNLQSSLNHEDGLGVASLAIIYSSMMIGTFIGPVSARVLGPKNLVLVGFFFHLLYILANFRPSYATLVPSSILLGFGISGLAMSMGLYLTASSKSFLFYSALSTSRLHGVLSMFNGFFYSCFKGTHISGNFISSIILFSSSYNETMLEGNVCGAGVCAASGNATVIENPDQNVVYTLLGVFAAFNLTGTLLTALCLPGLHVAAYQTESPKSQDACTNLSGCCRKFISWQFVILAPLFTAQAMAVMTMYTGYTKAFITCTFGVQWIGYSMTALGVSAAGSSLVVNNLVRFLGRPAIFGLGITLDLSSLVAMLIWEPNAQTPREFIFVLPAISGFSEGILQPQFNAFIASVFRENLPSAFSAFQASKCLGFLFVLSVSAFGCLYHQLYLALTLYTLGLLGYVATEMFLRASKRRFQSTDSVVFRDGGSCNHGDSNRWSSKWENESDEPCNSGFSNENDAKKTLLSDENLE